MKKYVRVCKECGSLIYEKEERVILPIYDKDGNEIENEFIDGEHINFHCSECEIETDAWNGKAIDDISILKEDE